MITNERFTELYKQVSTIFDCKEEQVPLLEIKEDYPELVDLENIFDTLGYFRCDTPDRVYLCQKQIEEFAKEKNLDIQILTEIITVHEISHYIHCKLNPSFCTATESDRFKKFTDYFEESFAQLLTHKFCNNNSKKYCSVFNTLKTGQSREYTIYGEIDNSLGGSLKQCPKSILENIFFGKNLEEEKEKIGDSTAEKYFFELFEKPTEEYSFKDYINSNSLKSDEVEDLVAQIDLGLATFNLSSLNPKFYFISEDRCSK